MINIGHIRMSFLMKVILSLGVFLISSPLEASSVIIEEVQDKTPAKIFTAQAEKLIVTLGEKNHFAQYISEPAKEGCVLHKTQFVIDQPAALSYVSRQKKHGPFWLAVTFRPKEMRQVTLPIEDEDLKEQSLRFHLVIKEVEPGNVQDFQFEVERLRNAPQIE
jgi:hypothetical protein